MVLAFRGATDIGSQDSGNPQDDITTNAQNLDFYGDVDTGASTPLFLGGDATWKDNITQINSARYFQVRISFISNAASNRTAELRSMAFAYRQL